MDKKIEDILQEHYEMLKSIEGRTLELEGYLKDLHYSASYYVDDHTASYHINFDFNRVDSVMTKLKREIERARARNDEISLLVRSGKL